MKMLITKRGYQRKYQVGGSGIFSKLKDVLSRFISKKQVVDMALNIARSVGQNAGQKAIAKLTPKSQQILSKLVSSPLSTPAPTVATATPNLNNLIAGSGQRQQQLRGPQDRLPMIKIQDLVRRLKKQNK